MLPLTPAGCIALYTTAPFEPEWLLLLGPTLPLVLFWLLLRRTSAALLALAVAMAA